MFFKPIFILSYLFCLIPKTIIGISEDDYCNQGDAYRRNCLVCLCSTNTNRWSCKEDICNDCTNDEIHRKDDSNFYCKNGRWTLLPFLQLPEQKRKSPLPFGPCKNEMFKPDWPCNRCQCNQTENVWECPLELCREDTMLNYSPKIHESRLDRLYEFFKYDGTKEICREGEIRDEDDCNRCVCNESIWWCKLKECPEMIEQDSVGADSLPAFLEIELPPGMDSIKEHEIDGIIKICNPGSKYNKGCNTCNCSMDGTAETCTQNICENLGNLQEEFYKSYYEEEYNENQLNSGSGEYYEVYYDDEYYNENYISGNYDDNYDAYFNENYSSEEYDGNNENKKDNEYKLYDDEEEDYDKSTEVNYYKDDEYYEYYNTIE